MMYGKTMTRQYDERGEIETSSGSSMELSDSPEAPRIYRGKTEAYWKNWPGAWTRLCELSAAALAKLPDNEFVRAQAWLCGIGDGGPRVADALARGAEREKSRQVAKDDLAKLFAAARETGKPVELCRYVTTKCMNGNDFDCSFDSAVEMAQPDGTAKTTYSCCY